MKWCKNCLNTSTRPRIQFDENGICNACIWADEKKKLDWGLRKKILKDIVKKIKKEKNQFDVVIPVSGGKDGSYVTYNLKKKYNLNPLCVTVHPPLRTELGYLNLENFKKNDINLIEVNLPYETHMKINKYGFINHGRPLHGWVIGIFSAVIKVAGKFNIKYIFYGEDGEVEYGGKTKLKNQPFFDLNFVKNIYLSKEYYRSLKLIKKKDLPWWNLDDADKKIKLTHWSFFENWNPYKNFIYAKKYFNYQQKTIKNIGTYTNFSQNDTFLYDLHCYLMYLKFGFGRGTQDIGIDIRRGSLTRKQGIELANLYDSESTLEHLDKYCDYFKMTKKNFNDVIDKFANKKLFRKVKNVWVPKFTII